MRRCNRRGTATARVWMLAGMLLLLPAADGSAEAEPRGGFVLPLACSPGVDCWVQNWPDRADGPDWRDPACGRLTYDGHDGIDIRVPVSAYRAGVAVLAPADGVVRAVRDGEADGVLRARGKAAVAGRECGNGVVLDHGDRRDSQAFQTQLCHMKPGSLRVRPGQAVKAGDVLGAVGESGAAAFPHVHLGMRRSGHKVDPLDGQALSGRRCTAAAPPPAPLFAVALPYTRGAIVEAGFIDRVPVPADEAAYLPEAQGGADPPVLIAWVTVMGPRTGDRLGLTLRGPDGQVLATEAVRQARDQAQVTLFAGARRPAAGWAPGRYGLEAALTPGNGARLAATRALIVPAKLR